MINSWYLGSGFLTVSWIDYSPYLSQLVFNCRDFIYIGNKRYTTRGIVNLVKVVGGKERKLDGFLSGEKFYIEGKEYKWR